MASGKWHSESQWSMMPPRRTQFNDRFYKTAIAFLCIPIFFIINQISSLKSLKKKKMIVKLEFLIFTHAYAISIYWSCSMLNELFNMFKKKVYFFFKNKVLSDHVHAYVHRPPNGHAVPPRRRSLLYLDILHESMAHPPSTFFVQRTTNKGFLSTSSHYLFLNY